MTGPGAAEQEWARPGTEAAHRRAPGDTGPARARSRVHTLVPSGVCKDLKRRAPASRALGGFSEASGVRTPPSVT